MSGRGKLLAVWSAFVAVFLGIPGTLFGVSRFRRFYPKQCPNGHGKMRRLDEASDDALLTKEQLLEEGLRSMDYDVWLCDVCGAKQVLPYSLWFSGYDACPKCKRKTCKTQSTIIEDATYASTGRRRVTRDCKNCSFHDEKIQVIPMKVASSGGSSSGGGGGGGGGGGSFGGGSAGGGGAGGSY